MWQDVVGVHLSTANFDSNSIEFSNRLNTSSIQLGWENITHNNGQTDWHTERDIKAQSKDLLVQYTYNIIYIHVHVHASGKLLKLLDIQVDLRPCGWHVLPSMVGQYLWGWVRPLLATAVSFMGEVRWSLQHQHHTTWDASPGENREEREGGKRWEVGVVVRGRVERGVGGRGGGSGGGESEGRRGRGVGGGKGDGEGRVCKTTKEKWEEHYVYDQPEKWHQSFHTISAQHHSIAW